MEMMSARCRFSTGQRHFWCQEQHDPNGILVGGEGLVLFVYTREEQWVIESGAPIRMGAARNSPPRSTGTLSWKSKVKILVEAFLSWGGVGGEQNSLC